VPTSTASRVDYPLLAFPGEDTEFTCLTRTGQVVNCDEYSHNGRMYSVEVAAGQRRGQVVDISPHAVKSLTASDGNIQLHLRLLDSTLTVLLDREAIALNIEVDMREEVFAERIRPVKAR